MIDFFKRDKDEKETTAESFDYDPENKCDKVIKVLVEKGKYICHVNGNAYIRLNSVVFGISLPRKYANAFDSCVITDWDSYEILKPTYGHWTALWEESTPSEHATHVFMNFINKAQSKYIDDVLKTAQDVQEVQNEPGK